MTIAELKKEAEKRKYICSKESDEYVLEFGDAMWLIDKATLAERERCAEIARKWGKGSGYNQYETADIIATAIEKDHDEWVTLEQDIQATWLKHGLRVTKETFKGHTWIIEAERMEKDDE